MLKRLALVLSLLHPFVAFNATAQALPACRVDDAPCLRRSLLNEAYRNDALADANQHLNSALKQQYKLYQLEHNRAQQLEMQAAQTPWYDSRQLWFGLGAGAAILGVIGLGVAAHH